MRNRLCRAALCVLAAGLLWRFPAGAQSTFATLTGTITDASGAAVPGADIEAVNTGTGYKYTAKSNEAGIYTIANLLEGTYRLRATAQGFQEFVAENVILLARDIRRIDVQFQVGQVATTVEVSAGVTLIETETARIADTRTRETMVDMPLSLRRAWDFIQLSPNVSKTKSGFNMRFGGSRTRQGDVTVDGVSISNVFGGQITGVVSDRTESYQEIRLEVAGGTAENPGIGQMAVVTRSGTNQLRGEAFLYYTSPGLQARNPFATASTGSIEWVPGGSLGGPVYIPKLYDGRNRTFFFSSIEFERFGPPTIQTFNTTVPLEPWRQGDFSGLLPGTVVRDPFAGNAPFAGNVLPRSRLNAAALRMQQFYPLPNFGDTRTLVAQNNRQNVDNPKLTNPTSVLRLDHRVTDRIFINGRWTRVRWPQEPFVGSLPTIGRVKRERQNNGLSLGYSHTLSPRLLSEFRYGYATDAFPATPPQRGLALVKELGFVGLAPDLPDVGGSPTVNFTNLGITGISNDVECRPCIDYRRHTFQENVSWLTTRHSVKFGVQVGRGSYRDQRQGAGLFGNSTFSNRFTGFTYADFLLGIPTTLSRNFPAIAQDTKSWTYGFFVQDQYRIRPNLTLNLGLRYDLLPGFTAANGLQSVFDIGSGKIVIPDGASRFVSPLMPKGYVDIVEASTAGFHSSRLLRADKNNFAPRFGLAYSVSSKWTVRSGIGVFYSRREQNQEVTQIGGNIPNTPNIVFPSVSASGTVTPPVTINTPLQALPSDPTLSAFTPQRPLSVLVRTADFENSVNPYSIQWNFSLQYEAARNTVVELAYSGLRASRLVSRINMNQIPFDVGIAGRNLQIHRPFPNINNAVGLDSATGNSSYNSLLVRVEKRLSDGLNLLANYTWSKNMEINGTGGSSAFSQNGGTTFPVDSWNLKNEKAVGALDVPHVFVLSFGYELPFGQGKPWLNRKGFANYVFGGWQLNGIFYRRSGFTTDIRTSQVPAANQLFATINVPDRVPGQSIYVDNRGVEQWFNPAAFTVPGTRLSSTNVPIRLFGNAQRRIGRGPRSSNLDFSLFKNFMLGERAYLQFRAEAFNLSNTPTFNLPGANSNALTIGNANFGRLTSSSSTGRQVQFGLKVIF